MAAKRGDIERTLGIRDRNTYAHRMAERWTQPEATYICVKWFVQLHPDIVRFELRHHGVRDLVAGRQRTPDERP